MKRYAIFFPQFYQVQVNDAAWGYGFTDWALVAAANAFNCWSRRAPASGFYDLSRMTDIQDRFDAAAGAGLDGFGIYHYRFEDGPELDKVECYLRQRPAPPGFGFFFIWANENWSRRWVDNDTGILKSVSAAPSQREVAAHVDYLKPYMEFDAYTRIMNKPMFVVYRPDWFSNPAETINLYRKEFARAGLSPSIGFFIKNVADVKYSKLFDFCYLFEPRVFLNFNGLRKNIIVINLYKKLTGLMSSERGEWMTEHINKYLRKGYRRFSFAEFLSYFESDERQRLVKSVGCPVQNILTAGWNNAPRYRHNFTQVDVPDSGQFSAMLNATLSDAKYSADIPLLCNAWNEWSEGAAIEPCAYLGDRLIKSYLHQ